MLPEHSPATVSNKHWAWLSATFKEFICNYNGEKLDRIGIDQGLIDELFVNERDGQPFKIRYSVPGSAGGSSEPVIFESLGENGTRIIAFLNMTQREVDEAEYDVLWAGKAQAAPTHREATLEH